MALLFPRPLVSVAQLVQSVGSEVQLATEPPVAREAIKRLVAKWALHTLELQRRHLVHS